MVNSCLVCFGGLFLIGGGIWWLNTWMFLMRAQQTTGTIVDENLHHIRSGSYVSPVVEFQTSSGEKIKFTESLGSSQGRDEGLGGIFMLIQYLFALRKGKSHDAIVNEIDTVQVVYDPMKPQRAHIKSFQYLHFIPVLLMVIGVFIGLSGFAFSAGFVSQVVNFLTGLADKLGWLF